MPLRRLRLEPLDAREVPANLTARFSPLTHTLTVIGDRADNQLTVRADPADPTRFFLSSDTDTINRAVVAYASPSGVRDIVIRMRGGDDTVATDPAGPTQVAGALTVDGGNGSNTLTATDLTVGGSLTVLNGAGEAADGTYLTNLRVGGSLTVRNGDGNSITNVQRDSRGVSVVHGSVRVVNGVGRDEVDFRDLNVRGDVTVRNGRAGPEGDGGTAYIYNTVNTTRSTIRGDVSIAFADGTGYAGVWDAVVGGDVTVTQRAGTNQTSFDGMETLEPVSVHGSVWVGGGADLRLDVGRGYLYFGRPGLEVGGDFTVAGGAGNDVLELHRLRVAGATRVALRGAGDRVAVDDSVFGGPVALATGAGGDLVEVDAAVETGGATSFERAVRMSLGGGDDWLTVAGDEDVHQAVVYLGRFVVRHGPGLDLLDRTPGQEAHPFGPGLEWLP